MKAGKKVYSWGKGYSFNPVGFINPIKDPENPELAQAGPLSANFEYVKSFSSEALQSFPFLPVLIPELDVTGTQFGELKIPALLLNLLFFFTIRTLTYSRIIVK